MDIIHVTQVLHLEFIQFFVEKYIHFSVYNCKYTNPYLCVVKEKFPLEFLQKWHIKNHESRLSGRYITGEMIAPLLEKYSEFSEVKIVGYSVKKRPIHAIEIGQGTTRVFMWSQMHGNESTTTKAVFDLLLTLQDNALSNFKETLLSHLRLCIIPMLNPDGAHQYTRNNANNIDLNRDAQELSQPESRILKNVYTAFAPDFCFNLHGQRTIYGFQATGAPSVLSFLSPSADEERSITLSRKRSMSIIAHIHQELQPLLPGAIGRYDDKFNLNCVGDTFQYLESPTVLFEAGHAPGDYSREQCRQYIFLALCKALTAVYEEPALQTQAYFTIPEHQKCYCDILIKNTANGSIGIQYVEKLRDGKIVFEPQLHDAVETSATYGHKTIDAQGAKVKLQFAVAQDENSQIMNITIGTGAPTSL